MCAAWMDIQQSFSYLMTANPPVESPIIDAEVNYSANAALSIFVCFLIVINKLEKLLIILVVL